MARQEEVCNALFDCVLMAAASTDQLSFGDLGLHKELVQVLKQGVVALQLLYGWRLLWELREAKLENVSARELARRVVQTENSSSVDRGVSEWEIDVPLLMWSLRPANRCGAEH